MPARWCCGSAWTSTGPSTRPSSAAGRPAGPGRGQAPPRSRSPQARVECEALKFALQHPDWTAEAAERWAPDWFSTPGTLAAFTALSEAGGPGKPLEAVLEAAATETDRRFLRGLAVEAFAAEETGGTLTRCSGGWRSSASPASSTSSRGHCSV